MENSFAADSYWAYLKNKDVFLDKNILKSLNTTLENTVWDEPESALDCNNFAVVALIEAEQCQDYELRSVYVEMAIEALNKGIEQYNHPLCLAHLAIVLALTGEIERAREIAFSTFINTLQIAYEDNQDFAAGIIYIPGEDKSFNQQEQIIQILKVNNALYQAVLLLGEVLCKIQIIFYNSTGLRLLNLAAKLFLNSAVINLRLGISSIVNGQWEGLLYLHQAQQLDPNYAAIIQALYLAYKDLGQIEKAKFWLDTAHNLLVNNSNSLDLRWSELEIDSLLTYVKFDDLLLAVEPSFRSIVTSVLIAQGDWFEKEMEFWRDQIQPGMTVIDVGANVGVYTFSAAQRVGSEGCVVAVEPFSGCVRCLQETCKINHLNWVKVCAGAASNYNGTVRITLKAASELNEVIDNETAGISLENTEEVACFALDSLIEQQSIHKVDFLKIDAEGHEIKVLEGCDRILNEFRPCILYENIAGAKSSNLVVADFLRSKGYQLFRYQPFLGQLIPINSNEELPGVLNIIALHPNQ